MTTRHDWRDARRILCVRLDNMGDVLMSTPAICALKASRADVRISLMASRSGAQVAPFLPDVDDTIEYDAAWVKNGSQGNEQDIAAIQQLSRGRFDAAVIFTVYSQNALPAAMMCHLAGIPLILAHSRENPYRLLSHWVRDTEPQQGIRHEVQRQLDLVASVGAQSSNTRLSFLTRQADRHSMLQVLRASQVLQSNGWIVVHCGATAESRRYGASGFSRVLSLLDAGGRDVLLTGSESERKLIDQIIAGSQSTNKRVNLAGRLNLGQLGCLIQDASLLISNNTGPVHIAAAVQTPVVDLYALTNPQHTPWQVEHRLLSCDVPCKYCYRSVCPQGHNACLNGIAPEEVVQAAYELLDNNRQAARVPRSNDSATKREGICTH
ncbi:glycosyl transferase [Pollutimonas subterranea]|uniref:Glycosyl transferase n=1 Tax=Pollutimonas subterranea TaxID=2045210 RepID=A0A2N4TZ05_9BURK|nr:glycosyltransferase family 9 protein [Pollutimonas subterranea]PLC48008.1 glycosyl transferase [Pollutimonas subterranea]